MDRWWDGRPDENYWLETTGRTDLGADLNAPQLNEQGREFWSYSAVTEVRDGDVVFHYHRGSRALVAWSRAVGEAWADEVFWGARGASARGSGVQPYRRPGWRMALEGPYYLDEPITLAQLREREPEIRAVHEDLEAETSGSLYFPFALSPTRPLRGTQFYLTKFPRSLVDLFPGLIHAAAEAVGTAGTPAEPAPRAKSKGLGGAYRRADESVSLGKRDPFAVDPAAVERGMKGHAAAQNALADFVASHGWEVISPGPGEPQFDAAWWRDGVLYVAEVKSITDFNEERQLRLGLGQVLRYTDLLATGGREVRAVLVPEREPSDPGWMALAQRLGVLLVWPAAFGAIKEDGGRPS